MDIAFRSELNMNAAFKRKCEKLMSSRLVLETTQSM